MRERLRVEILHHRLVAQSFPSIAGLTATIAVDPEMGVTEAA